jgi:TatD DNase family protein
MLIDSHVNLHAPQFDEDRDAVIARARAAGIRLMVNISDRVSGFEACTRSRRPSTDIWCTVERTPMKPRKTRGLRPTTSS